MDFNEYAWHDVIIKKISIDRSSPGYCDSILIDVEWPDTKPNVLVFHEVYEINMNLRFGFVAPDSIFKAHMIPQVHYVNEFMRMNDVEMMLNRYVIETAVTTSAIEILAKRFEIQ